jgi:hypothetical protein
MFDSLYRKVMLVVWEPGKTRRRSMMKKLMQEIQPFTINLRLFSRKSILISGKEKICAVFLCLQREKK